MAGPTLCTRRTCYDSRMLVTGCKFGARLVLTSHVQGPGHPMPDLHVFSRHCEEAGNMLLVSLLVTEVTRRIGSSYQMHQAQNSLRPTGSTRRTTPMPRPAWSRKSWSGRMVTGMSTPVSRNHRPTSIPSSLSEQAIQFAGARIPPGLYPVHDQVLPGSCRPRGAIFTSGPKDAVPSERSQCNNRVSYCQRCLGSDRLMPRRPGGRLACHGNSRGPRMPHIPP